MKINLKAILSSLVGIACLLVGAVRTADAQSDLFVSVNAPGPGSTPGAVYRYTPTAVQSTFLPDVSKPRGLAFDSAGNMFLSSNTSPADLPRLAQSFGLPPTARRPHLRPGSRIIFSSRNSRSMGMAISSSILRISAVRATTITGTVFKVLPDGTVTTFGTVPGQAFGVAVDSAGNVFAASAGTDRTIYKFTPAGVRSVFAGPANFSGAQGPIGLMFDSAGNLFASAADSTVPARFSNSLRTERRLFSPLA